VKKDLALGHNIFAINTLWPGQREAIGRQSVAKNSWRFTDSVSARSWGAWTGGAISSDDGGMLLAEVEARTRILALLAEQFVDHHGERMEHSLGELIAQGVLVLALGCWAVSSSLSRRM
jgi:hypothetical protein